MVEVSKNHTEATMFRADDAFMRQVRIAELIRGSLAALAKAGTPLQTGSTPLAGRTLPASESLEFRVAMGHLSAIEETSTVLWVRRAS